VGYCNVAGFARAKAGKYQGAVVWWGEEVEAEQSLALSQWRYMN